jgi:hypothetical protein
MILDLHRGCTTINNFKMHKVIPQSKLQNAQCLKQYCNKNKLKNTVLIQEN